MYMAHLKFLLSQADVEQILILNESFNFNNDQFLNTTVSSIFLPTSTPLNYFVISSKYYSYVYISVCTSKMTIFKNSFIITLNKN